MSWPALQLDLAVPPRRPRWAGYLLLAGALALAGALLARYQEAQRTLERLDTAQQLLSDSRPALARPERGLEEEMKRVHVTLRQLEHPWVQLVESLEAAATPGVAVLLVQPEAQHRLLRVTAEALGEQPMLAYLRRLEASGLLTEVHLVSHEVKEDDPRRPIQFALQASFRAVP